MRTVTYGGACSLDGFIAGPDDAIDWLHFSSDVQEVMAAYWATIDTVLIGRKTWEVAARSGGAPAVGQSITTYVFSRTLREAPPAVHLVADDAGAFVRKLKRQRGKGICLLGGGELARALFEADVIDEVGLNIHPVLLGSGVPAFHDAGRRIALELLESRVLEGGCVLATYRVRHRRR
jgi:dihydrofolate reductase